MLIQTLSAKLGIATGRNLPEVCREPFLAADLVPPLGAGGGDRDGDRSRRVPRRGDRLPPALRLRALPVGGHLRASRPSRSSGCSASAFRAARGGDRVARRRDRRLLRRRADLRAPGLRRRCSTTLSRRSSAAARRCCSSVGILGATVMPHVIYLHSALTQDRLVPETDEDAQTLLRYTRIDVVIAMTIAGADQRRDARDGRVDVLHEPASCTSTRSRARTRRSSRSSAAHPARSSRSR